MAVIDWFSRKVLSWRVFNTMDAGQYAGVLRETIEEYGCPAIFNTDQGSQFTSDVFVNVLLEYGIEISIRRFARLHFRNLFTRRSRGLCMDGCDRVLDNIRIERL